jgi:hypothetical protein
LIEQARTSGKAFEVVTVPMGHHQMSESPEETLNALKAFFNVKA